jgi:hypothetical protein
MVTRALYRRLERLEEQTMPMDEPKVWQIVFRHSDGTQTLGDRIEWSPRGRWREANPLKHSPSPPRCATRNRPSRI